MKYLKIPTKANPFKHQKRAFEFVMHKFETDSGAALLVETGCGKWSQLCIPLRYQ